MNTRRWIISKWTDLFLFFIPVWLVWIVFFSDVTYFENASLPLWCWVVFILGIDVSHVWSSLFRTYLDKDEFQAQKRVLIWAPIIVFGLSIGALFISVGVFWRIMAYLAIFHFIKQQYGFVALYKARVKDRFNWFISDKLIIYIATIYPIVYWHFNSDSKFNWFVQNDFFQLPEGAMSDAILHPVFNVLNYLYWGIILLWGIIQIRAKIKGENISNGKILWCLTTAVNWWFGIVYFNSDLVFSISNVVAHGIPYLGLIYYYKVQKDEIVKQKTTPWFMKLKWVGVLISTVLLFALLEEYFWDMLIYREHASFFEVIYPYNWSQLNGSPAILIAMAVLALTTTGSLCY